MADPKGNGDLFPDFRRLMGDWRVPGFDFEALAQCQRKNIEAFTQANQLALEGTQAWMRRNLELARETMEEMSAMLSEFTRPTTSMEERFQRQAEYSKKAVEKSLANIRDLTELMSKTNSDALGVLSKRVTEGLEEVRELTQQKAA
ncbi:MAG TPA: phasin family protein [Stellaceae bacterium]|nr:phasin family protein [Stellaceae bacterium]